MKKPEIKHISYYDWDMAWEYIKSKYKFTDKIPKKQDSHGHSNLWNYICDKHEIYNGKIFTLSNWKFMHNNGEFVWLIPEWYRPILLAFINEFGEIDKDCLTKNTKTANFQSSW